MFNLFLQKGNAGLIRRVMILVFLLFTALLFQKVNAQTNYYYDGSGPLNSTSNW